MALWTHTTNQARYLIRLCTILCVSIGFITELKAQQSNDFYKAKALFENGRLENARTTFKRLLDTTPKFSPEYDVLSYWHTRTLIELNAELYETFILSAINANVFSAYTDELRKRMADKFFAVAFKNTSGSFFRVKAYEIYSQLIRGICIKKPGNATLQASNFHTSGRKTRMIVELLDSNHAEICYKLGYIQYKDASIEERDNTNYWGAYLDVKKATTVFSLKTDAHLQEILTVYHKLGKKTPQEIANYIDKFFPKTQKDVLPSPKLMDFKYRMLYKTGQGDKHKHNALCAAYQAHYNAKDKQNTVLSTERAILFGLSAQADSNYNAAVYYFEYACQQDMNINLHLNLGSLYLKIGQPDNAADFLEHVLITQTKPTNSQKRDLHELLGNTYRAKEATQNHYLAIHHYRQALKATTTYQSRDLDLLKMTVNLCLKVNEHHQANEVWQEFYDKNKKNLPVSEQNKIQELQGDIFWFASRYEDYLKWLSTRSNKSERAYLQRYQEANIILAKRYYNQDDFDKALEYYEASVNQSVQVDLMLEAYFYMGQCHYRLYNYAESEKYFVKLNTGSSFYAQSMLTRGYIRFEQGKYPEAAEFFNAHAKMNHCKDDVQCNEALMRSADCSRFLKDYAEAKALYMTVFEKSKASGQRSNFSLYLNLAICCFYLNEYSAAQGYLGMVIAPNDKFTEKGEALYWLALLQKEQKQNKAAMSTLASFFKDYSEHRNTPEARMLYANLYEDFSPRISVENYKQLIEEHPTHQLAYQGLARLEYLQTKGIFIDNLDLLETRTKLDVTNRAYTHLSKSELKNLENKVKNAKSSDLTLLEESIDKHQQLTKSGSVRMYLNLLKGYIYYKRNTYDRAKSYLKEILNTPSQAHLYQEALFLMIKMEVKGDEQLLLTYIDKLLAISRNPEYTTCAKLIKIEIKCKKGEYRASKELTYQVLQHSEGTHHAEAYFWLGKNVLAASPKDSLNKATAYFEKATRYKNATIAAEAHLELAKCYISARSPENALAVIQNYFANFAYHKDKEAEIKLIALDGLIDHMEKNMASMPENTLKQYRGIMQAQIDVWCRFAEARDSRKLSSDASRIRDKWHTLNKR